MLALLGALLAVGCSSNGSVREVVKGSGVRLVEAEGTWSPDGRWLASAAANGVVLSSPDGKRKREITAPPVHINFGWGTPIEWSPDSRRLFYATASGPEGRGGYWATEVSLRDEVIAQTSLGTELAFPAFSPAGWPLVFATGPYEYLPRGGRRGPAAGLRMLTGPGSRPQILFNTSGMPEDPVVSPDGRQVLFKQWRRGHTEIWRVGIDGSDPRRLGRFLYLRRYEWSPNGRWIALSAVGTSGGSTTHGLYLLRSTGGLPVRVGNAELYSGPFWSPDGRWIAYATTDGAVERVRPRGGKTERLAEFDGEGVGPLRWSPDGRTLTYRASPLPDEYD
jgi:Tol biopolymer transport system component